MSTGNFKITFPCPECGLEFPVSLHQLGEGGIVVCPRCRANNAKEELKEIERQLLELGRSLQNVRQSLEGKINLKPRA